MACRKCRIDQFTSCSTGNGDGRCYPMFIYGRWVQDVNSPSATLCVHAQVCCSATTGSPVQQSVDNSGDRQAA